MFCQIVPLLFYGNLLLRLILHLINISLVFYIEQSKPVHTVGQVSVL